METRTLGRTGIEVGVVGLGTEHLSTGQENVDTVFDMGVAAGLNYIDLVYNDPSGDYGIYWDEIGPAVRRHRQDLVLALHWGFIYHEPIDQCLRSFHEALDLLGNGYAEIAMLTMVDTEVLWQDWARKGIEHLHRFQREGRVGYIGMSNHSVEVARTAVESGLIDVLMFPINLYQHPDDPARAALLETCAEHGTGVVAMKPYYGGVLLERDGMPTGITPAQCLHYALSQPITTTVPGVRDPAQMGQTLAYLKAPDAEKQATPLHGELKDWLQGQCVRCKHCLPCPEEIPIPSVIYYLNYVEYFGLTPFHQEQNRKWYRALPANGADCIECGICLERCPFDVDIIAKMRRAAEVFATAA